MIRRMSIFEPLHIGRYTMKLTNYESEGEHLTFFGKKILNMLSKEQINDFSNNGFIILKNFLRNDYLEAKRNIDGNVFS